MSMNQSLQAALQGFNNWEETGTSDGSGGSNPNFFPEGIHDALITGYSVSEGNFFYKGLDQQGVEVPCPILTFNYEYEIPEGSPEYDAENVSANTIQTAGTPFQILTSAQIEALPETNGCKQRTRVDIMNQRLKQHLKVLNGGETSDSFEADMTSALGTLDGESMVSVQVYAEHRKKNAQDPNSPVYKTEFLRELLVG